MSRLLLLCAAVTLAACGDSSSIGGVEATPTNDPVVGQYALETVDGDTVPATIGDVTFLEGTLSLNGDGTFVEFVRVRLAPGPGQDERTLAATSDGSFTRDGTTVILRLRSGRRVFTTYENDDIAYAWGDALGLPQDAFAMVFSR